MKITFLGTGAADFSPLLETEFKDKFDKNARRSSAILIDGRFLVDCGPHTFHAMEMLEIPMEQITDLFLTHLHSDHCNWDNIRALAAKVPQPLRIWHRVGAAVQPVENAEFHPMESEESAVIDGLTVKALAANHAKWPLHYDFELDGVKMFYGCDGAWLLHDTYYAMRGRNYDCMIMDATVGDYVGDYRMGEHNSIPMIRMMAASFETDRVIAVDGQLWLSHLARTLNKPHDETVELLKKDGFFAAYDGLTIAIC